MRYAAIRYRMSIVFVMLVALGTALGCAATEEPEQPAAARPAATAAPAAAPVAAPDTPAAPAMQPQQQPVPAAPARAAEQPQAPIAPTGSTQRVLQARTGPDSGTEGMAPTEYVAKFQQPGSYWAYGDEYSPRPTTFRESPTFAQMVRDGQLPPLDQRLPVPDDVYVFAPPDEIGVYGGQGRIITGGKTSRYLKFESLQATALVCSTMPTESTSTRWPASQSA